MKKLKLPVQAELVRYGEIKIEKDELIRLLGEPQAEESDPAMVPGPTKYWAFEVEGGRKVLLEYGEFPRVAEVYASSSDIDNILTGLGISTSTIIWRRMKE